MYDGDESEKECVLMNPPVSGTRDQKDEGNTQMLVKTVTVY